MPAGKIVHVILVKYAAHKHPKVRRWLDRHPRFTFHFTPNLVLAPQRCRRIFAKLAKRRLKRGVFRSVVDLQAAINRFVAETNNDPIPFTVRLGLSAVLGPPPRLRAVNRTRLRAPMARVGAWLVTWRERLEPRTELHEKAVDLLLCSSERECFALGIHSKGIVGEDGQVKAYGPRAIVPMVALAEDLDAITPIRCLTLRALLPYFSERRYRRKPGTMPAHEGLGSKRS